MSLRSAALADLEQALRLTLQAMAANDCCADENDPDWRGPAITAFRADLLALGVTDAELDAAGIRTDAANLTGDDFVKPTGPAAIAANLALFLTEQTGVPWQAAREADSDEPVVAVDMETAQRIYSAGAVFSEQLAPTTADYEHQALTGHKPQPRFKRWSVPS